MLISVRVSGARLWGEEQERRTVRTALSQAAKAASAAMYLALLQAMPIWSSRIESSLLLASKSLAAWYVASLAPSVQMAANHNQQAMDLWMDAGTRVRLPSLIKASASG
jgi:hypothetical protein